MTQMESPRIDSSRIAEVSLSSSREEIERRDKVFTVENLAYNNEGAYSFKATLIDYEWLDPDLVVLYASNDNRDAARRFRIAGVPTLTLRVDRIADFRRLPEREAAQCDRLVGGSLE